MKKCIKCGEEKEIDLFVRGRNSCKKCMFEYKKNHRQKNSEKIKEYMSNYYDSNKDEILERLKENYKSNRDSKLDYQKNYATNNKEKIKKYKSEHAKLNKEKITEYKSNYQRERRKSDPLFKLKFSISSMIRKAFKNKNYTKKSKTFEILGCDVTFFKNYIEEKFTSEMTWENHGTFWDIDHIIPLSTAKSEDDVIKLNHYTNLQPLNSYINRVIKKDRVDFQ